MDVRTKLTLIKCNENKGGNNERNVVVSLESKRIKVSQYAQNVIAISGWQPTPPTAA